MRRIATLFLTISFSIVCAAPSVHAQGAVSLFLDEKTITKGYRVASADGRLNITLRPKAVKKPTHITIDMIASQTDAQERFPIDSSLEFASDVYVYDAGGILPSDMRQSFLLEIKPENITPWTSLYFFDRGQKYWKRLPTRPVAVDTLRASSPLPFAPIAALQKKKNIGGANVSALLGHAKAILVIDNRNSILVAKQARLQVPPASITKLMTALVFLEHNPGWKKKITIVPSDDAEPARIPFVKKEQVTVYDLFMGMLVGSNNNAAKALARSTGMSEAAFLSAMNAHAARLRMYHTTFFDTSGLDVRNVSTAEDIARLAHSAFRQEDISAALSAKTYVIRGAQRTYSVKTTNALLASAQAVKGKTGYIDESGYNFVGKAGIGATTATIAVLGASTSAERFDVIRKLLRLVR